MTLPPGGDFILYLCVGPRRDGNLAQQLAGIKFELKVVLVVSCPQQGGFNFSDQKVINTLEALAARSGYVAVIASPPRSSGSAIVINCLQVVRAAITHCAAFLFEHHILHAAGAAYGGARTSVGSHILARVCRRD